MTTHDGQAPAPPAGDRFVRAIDRVLDFLASVAGRDLCTILLPESAHLQEDDAALLKAQTGCSNVLNTNCAGGRRCQNTAAPARPEPRPGLSFCAPEEQFSRRKASQSSSTAMANRQ